MKRKMLMMLLIIALVLCASATAAAVSDFEDGQGTSVDPWQIKTAEQLHNVRNYLESGLYFILIDDIDLNEDPWNTGEGWEPIGNENEKFMGSFDGKGHIISGLFIDRPDDDYGVGLFGAIGEGAVIKNAKLTDVDVTGDDYVGGLVGQNWGTISNCYVSGEVNGEDETVGGLVGINRPDGTITESHASVDVTGDARIGGLAGDNRGIIERSSAEGAVDGSRRVGGLVGYNQGAIEESFATGAVSGQREVGGLVGQQNGLLANADNTTITNCYASGEVSGDEDVGGLVGYILNTAPITNSYARGAVTGKIIDEVKVGGLVGSHSGDPLVIEHCYYDTQTTGQGNTGIGAGDDTGIYGLTTEEMKLQGSYDDSWDFSQIWNIYSSINDGYPFLRWQEDQVDIKVNKSVNKSFPDLNENVVFTITVKNYGPADATGVVVKDLLPAGLTYDSSTLSEGTYIVETGLWTIGDLDVDETETLTITAKVEESGTITNVASLYAVDQYNIGTYAVRASASINHTIGKPGDGLSAPKAAPALANQILKEHGIGHRYGTGEYRKNGKEIYSNYITEVARQTRGNTFDGVSKFDVDAYYNAVYDYLKGLGADLP